MPDIHNTTYLHDKTQVKSTWHQLLWRDSSPSSETSDQIQTPFTSLRWSTSSDLTSFCFIKPSNYQGWNTTSAQVTSSLSQELADASKIPSTNAWVTNHRKQGEPRIKQAMQLAHTSAVITWSSIRTHQDYPLTVWSQHFSPQPANSTSTLNKEPNKDTISNQSNSTPEMTFGQAFSFNLTFSLISAQDGNLLHPKLAEPDNLYLNQNLRLLLLPTPISAFYRCWSHHNKQQPTQSDKDGPSPIQAQDDDKESSSSSESDSSSSSDDEVVAPSCAQSLFVMNKKSHIIHAAAQTNPSSTKRACFQSKGSTSKFVVVLLWSEFLLKRYHPFFLVHCASEKHALQLLTTYYLKLSVWEVASLVPEHKRDVFPQMEVFLQFALALSTRCLYTKKMVDHFHLHRMGFPHSIS